MGYQMCRGMRSPECGPAGRPGGPVLIPVFGFESSSARSAGSRSFRVPSVRWMRARTPPSTSPPTLGPGRCCTSTSRARCARARFRRGRQHGPRRRPRTLSPCSPCDTSQHERRSYFTLLKRAQLDEALNRIGLDAGGLAAYAAFSAAERQAPQVRQPKAWLYVSAELTDSLERHAQAKEVDSGENLVVLIDHGSGGAGSRDSRAHRPPLAPRDRRLRGPGSRPGRRVRSTPQQGGHHRGLGWSRICRKPCSRVSCDRIDALAHRVRRLNANPGPAGNQVGARGGPVGRGRSKNTR
jgi:hypothetical protein